jgi:hypothetical protein
MPTKKNTIFIKKIIYKVFSINFNFNIKFNSFHTWYNVSFLYNNGTTLLREGQPGLLSTSSSIGTRFGEMCRYRCLNFNDFDFTTSLCLKFNDFDFTVRVY